MDNATTISLGALLVSVGSLSVTLWATRLSNKSLNHAIEIQQKNEEKEFERLRTDLLMQVADSRRLMDKTRIEIGTLKADFEAEPQPIKMLMANYANLFTYYFPKVEDSISRLDILSKDVSGWPNEKSYRELMNAKALLYQSLKQDEVVYDVAIYLINEFKAQLQVARKKIAQK